MSRLFISEAVEYEHVNDKREIDYVTDKMIILPWIQFVLSHVIDNVDKFRNSSDCKANPKEKKKTGSSMTLHFVIMLEHANEELMKLISFYQGMENFEKLTNVTILTLAVTIWTS